MALLYCTQPHLITVAAGCRQSAREKVLLSPAKLMKCLSKTNEFQYIKRVIDDECMHHI